MFKMIGSGGLLGAPLGLLVMLASATGTKAQEVPVDVRRAQATRAELESALAQLEQVVASPGFSKSYRKSREGEAVMVRQRLAEGDFQVGDQIDIIVVQEPTLTGKFTVLTGRVLTLPQLPPISLQGVLRSEVRDYLTAEIGKYVKNPQVTIQGSYIRLAMLGAIGKPGYYTFPAEMLVSDAIMQAGGPGGVVKMEKSVVRRQGVDVVQGTEIQRAIEGGQSLDQLNLHGGDEMVFGSSGNILAGGRAGGGGGGWQRWFWPVQAAVSLSYLLMRIF